MDHRCPACNRTFTVPGFCPYDGKPLEGVKPDDAAATRATDAAAAQPDPRSKPDTNTSLRAFSAKESSSAKVEALTTIREQPPTTYDRLIGETLDGRYYVQAKIGEGGMGVVFAVKHAVIERPLAIKVLKREVMRDQGTVKRFIQEARAASRIGHPNIVDVTDFGHTADGMTYQVMELIDGTTLKATIKQEAPLPTERAVRIAQQIARALAAAHAKGIVHRDLKPENVFLTEREGRPDFVKIVDFGIAKVAPVEGRAATGPRITAQGAVFGTPEYMSPEQASGKGDTDHRVDIYALGTILYEMLVGKTPHKGDTSIRTIAMQMLDSVIPPSKRNPDVHVPEDLEAIVMKALAKKREDRHATMNELQAALDVVSTRLASADSLPPPETSTEPDISPPMRRSKPPTRPLHEPQFVERQTPHSFDHVYDDEKVDPERPSRWPMILAGLVMLVLGTGGAILLITVLQKDEPQHVSSRSVDAGLVALAEAPHDAQETLDAKLVTEVPADAGHLGTTVQRDAGVSSSVPTGRAGKGNVTIEVLTRPAEANVFVGYNYRGPSGVKLTERRGTKLKIECKTERTKGSIEVVFDGKLTAVMCTATRNRFCVTGLKNPYDDCEEDPNLVP
jgi:serine/threonine protein kinase